MHGCIIGSIAGTVKQALFGIVETFWCKILIMKAIKKSSESVYRQLEDVVGCKWSVSVLQAVAAGVLRPGSLGRYIEGISTKVLSERLRKLTVYGLLEKQIFAEVPPRTEYSLTQNGLKLVTIVDQIKALDKEILKTEIYGK